MSLAIQHELPKITSAFRFALQGLGIGIPYYAFNELLTGILIRRYGKEQYFFSNLGAGMLTALGYFTVLAASGKRRFELTK